MAIAMSLGILKLMMPGTLALNAVAISSGLNGG